MKKDRRHIKIRLLTFEESEQEKGYAYWKDKSVQERLLGLYQINKACCAFQGIDFTAKGKRIIKLVDKKIMRNNNSLPEEFRDFIIALNNNMKANK